MAEIPDASVDLVVTSPPYPMIEMWDGMFTEQDDRIGVDLTDGEGAAAFEKMAWSLGRGVGRMRPGHEAGRDRLYQYW